MSFPDAVPSSLRQYVTWRGPRQPLGVLVVLTSLMILVSIVTGILDSVLGTEALGNLASLALLLPSLAVAVRRLHDSGKSAWWLLATVVPIVLAVVLMCRRPDRGARVAARRGFAPPRDGHRRSVSAPSSRPSC